MIYALYVLFAGMRDGTYRYFGRTITSGRSSGHLLVHDGGDGRLPLPRCTDTSALSGRAAMTVRIRVIPCLDVADGRVVKGVNFVDLKDAGDPVEQARAYDAAGADELCFLDISASHEGRGTLLDIVSRTAEVCFMPLTVGGGVRTVEDARALLLAGADKVAVNSAAVSRPEVVADIADRMGSQCIVASIDARAVKAAQDGSGAALGNLYPWRPTRDRHRCGRACGKTGAAGRGRIACHFDGRGRHPGRIRS